MRTKYKFTLEKPKDFFIKELKGVYFRNKWCSINDGYLIINRGYSWNGCTMATDTDRTYVASLIHDLLYQFTIVDKELADFVFFKELLNNKFKFAKLYYLGVVLFGEKFYKKKENFS